MARQRRPQVQRVPSSERSVIEFMTVRATSLAQNARTVMARLFGVGSPTAPDDEQESVEDSEVLHPVGFMARPVIQGTIEAIAVRDGDEVHVLYFNRKDGAALTASDLAEGETAIFSDKEPTASMTFRANGDVEVRCKTGSKVKLFADGQTANKPVAHEGSATAGHTHAAGAYTAGMTAVTGTSASATDSIATGQGSQNVEVPT